MLATSALSARGVLVSLGHADVADATVSPMDGLTDTTTVRAWLDALPAGLPAGSVDFLLFCGEGKVWSFWRVWHVPARVLIFLAWQCALHADAVTGLIEHYHLEEKVAARLPGFLWPEIATLCQAALPPGLAAQLFDDAWERASPELQAYVGALLRRANMLAAIMPAIFAVLQQHNKAAALADIMDVELAVIRANHEAVAAELDVFSRRQRGEPAACSALVDAWLGEAAGGALRSIEAAFYRVVMDELVRLKAQFDAQRCDVKGTVRSLQTAVAAVAAGGGGAPATLDAPPTPAHTPPPPPPPTPTPTSAAATARRIRAPPPLPPPPTPQEAWPLPAGDPSRDAARAAKPWGPPGTGDFFVVVPQPRTYAVTAGGSGGAGGERRRRARLGAN